jgi:predicted metal-dependent phosphoesterase TrpH
MPKIDLHTHTTASDGALAPRELVRKAVEHRVGVLAITDHDSTDGIAEARDEAARHGGLTLVPGLEINCNVEGAEIHILGYLVDHEAPWFQEFLREQRAARTARVYRLTERLAELGLFIDPAEVFALAGEAAPGRPHVAQVMVKRGYVHSVREAFDRYLRSDGPANVPRHRLTPLEAIDVIRRARGVPVFAHPGLADRDAMIPALVDAGLQGIETYYAEHSAGQVRSYLDLCRRFDLVATGGSDFHGPHTGRTNPPGSPAVPIDAWEGLQARAARARV